METLRNPKQSFNLHLGVVLLLLLVLGFLVGAVHLMQIRFEAGDVYPAYSSFRSDPLGTKAFYESLEALEGVAVRRNLRSLALFKPGERVTLFITGAGLSLPARLPRELVETADRIMGAGGRVVITFRPMNYDLRRKPENRKKNPGAKDPEGVTAPEAGSSQEKGDEAESSRITGPETDGPPSEAPAADGGDFDLPRYLYLRAHWGLGIRIHLQPDDKADAVFSSTAAARIPDLPRGISWHSAAYFEDLAESWRILYSCDGQPVMVERPIRSGSLVLATDSFFISNEALKSERIPQLLTGLIGPNAIVVLEETHHGIRQQPGVIGYLRRHRLHWILIALLMVAGLFVWQNSLPLVPPGRRGSPYRVRSAVPARNVAQGLTNLLRRNIPPGQLLSVCYTEWEKFYEKDGRFPADRRERARRIANQRGPSASAKPDSANGYRDISRILAEGIHHE